MQALPFALLAIAFYLGAASWQALTLLRRVPQRPKMVRSLGTLALAFHGLVISGVIHETGGLWLGLSPSLVMVSALVTGLLILGSLAKPVLNIAVGVFPVAAVTLVTAVAWPGGEHQSHLTPGIAVHAISSALAFALLAIAAVQAILLAWQNQALRHHHIRGIVQTLPPLTTMERVLFELIWAGMILLTLAIASGFLFLDNLFAQHLMHKTVLSLAAWFIFAAPLDRPSLAGLARAQGSTLDPGRRRIAAAGLLRHQVCRRGHLLLKPTPAGASRSLTAPGGIPTNKPDLSSRTFSS